MKDPEFVQYDEEIELIDIFRVLWKWKVFICLGVVLFGLAGFGFCYFKDRVYRVSMTIQPGMRYSSDGSKQIQIDSSEVIVGRIGAGIYDGNIIDKVIHKPAMEKPESLTFGVDIPEKTNVIHVSYDTSDVEEGKKILSELFDLLRHQERDLTGNILENLNRQINLQTIELEKRKQIEQSYVTNVKNIEKRIQDLAKDIERMNKSSNYLSNERKKLLERKTDADGALSVLLYSNTIQQNIQFVNSVKKDMNDHKLLKERELQKVIAEKNEQKKITEDIFNKEKIRENIIPMKLIKTPTPERSPISPRTRIVVLLSLIAGFFVMIFASFLAEYIRNNSSAIRCGQNQS